MGTSFPGVPFFMDSNYQLIDDINEFFSRYILVDGRINSPKTWKSYAYWLLDFLKWTIANNLNWKYLTISDIVVYRNWSIETCSLTPSTVNLRIGVLKRFYQYAFENNLVNHNPIKSIETKFYVDKHSDFLSHSHKLTLTRNLLSVKTHSELPKFYSDVDLVKIFNVVHSDRLRLMMRLMLECGLRRQEVAELPLVTIEETIKIAQKIGPSSEILLKLPAYICKGNKSRSVIISYPTVMRLMQYRATVRPKLEKKFKSLNKKIPINFWLTHLGTEYKPESLSIEISLLGKKAGVEKATPHKFRHTFATNLFALTNDLRLVQKLLGHSHIHTTTIYEHTAANDRLGLLADYQNNLNNLLK